MYRAVKWTTLLGMQFRMHLRWEISHTEENEKIQNDLRTKASDTDLREGSSVFEQQEAPSFCSDLTHWSCFPPNRNDLPRSVCRKDKHCLAADRTREARWQTRLLQTLRKNGTGILLKWGIFSTHVADLSLEWCHFMAELSESQTGFNMAHKSRSSGSRAYSPTEPYLESQYTECSNTGMRVTKEPNDSYSGHLLEI